MRPSWSPRSWTTAIGMRSSFHRLIMTKQAQWAQWELKWPDLQTEQRVEQTMDVLTIKAAGTEGLWDADSDEAC